MRIAANLHGFSSFLCSFIGRYARNYYSHSMSAIFHPQKQTRRNQQLSCIPPQERQQPKDN